MRFSLALLVFSSCLVAVLSGRTLRGNQLLQRGSNRNHGLDERDEPRTCTPASTRKIREWWPQYSSQCLRKSFSLIALKAFFAKDRAKGLHQICIVSPKQAFIIQGCVWVQEPLRWFSSSPYPEDIHHSLQRMLVPSPWAWPRATPGVSHAEYHSTE